MTIFGCKHRRMSRLISFCPIITARSPIGPPIALPICLKMSVIDWPPRNARWMAAFTFAAASWVSPVIDDRH